MTITINPYLMLLVFVVFLATLYLLNIWLYKPMFSFMDKRDNAINQDLASIQNSTQEVQKIDAEAKEILEAARLESIQIIELATNEAKQAYEAKISKKKEESATKLEKFFNELENERNHLKNQLLETLPEFEKSLKLKISQI